MHAALIPSSSPGGLRSSRPCVAHWLSPYSHPLAHLLAHCDARLDAGLQGGHQPEPGVVSRSSSPGPGRHRDPESVTVVEHRRIGALKKLVLDGATYRCIFVDLGSADFEQCPTRRRNHKRESSAAIRLVSRVDRREPCQREPETASVCRRTESLGKRDLKECLFVGTKHVSCYQSRPVRCVGEQPGRRHAPVTKQSTQPAPALRARDPRVTLPGHRLAPACRVDNKRLRQHGQGLIGHSIVSAVGL